MNKSSQLNLIDCSIQHIVQNIRKGIKSGDLKGFEKLSPKEIEMVARVAQGPLEVMGKIADDIAINQLRNRSKKTVLSSSNPLV
ncbi:hypothetical protein KJ918_08240 [Patescibacteria group bacterium]|nr:hypothetical protein [Patescibacteria group bacterium]